MIIRVSELEEQGLRIDDVEAFASVRPDPSWRLESIALQVEPDGRDVLVHGRLGASMSLTCGRCVETFPGRVDDRHGRPPRPATSWRRERRARRRRSRRGFLRRRSGRSGSRGGERGDAGAADEASVPARLPRAVRHVRSQPQRGGVYVRAAPARPAAGAPCATSPPGRPTEIRWTDRKDVPSCRCRNDATPARAGASAAPTTSWRLHPRRVSPVSGEQAATPHLPALRVLQGSRSSLRRNGVRPPRPTRVVVGGRSR